MRSLLRLGLATTLLLMFGCAPDSPGAGSPTLPQDQGVEFVGGAASALSPNGYLISLGCHTSTREAKAGMVVVHPPTGGYLAFDCAQITRASLKQAIGAWREAVRSHPTIGLMQSGGGGSGDTDGYYFAGMATVCVTEPGYDEMVVAWWEANLPTLIVNHHPGTTWCAIEEVWLPIDTENPLDDDPGAAGGTPGDTVTPPPPIPVDSICKSTGDFIQPGQNGAGLRGPLSSQAVQDSLAALESESIASDTEIPGYIISDRNLNYQVVRGTPISSQTDNCGYAMSCKARRF